MTWEERWHPLRREWEADVAWVGYANASLRRRVEPVLQAALARRGLRPEQGWR